DQVAGELLGGVERRRAGGVRELGDVVADLGVVRRGVRGDLDVVGGRSARRRHRQVQRAVRSEDAVPDRPAGDRDDVPACRGGAVDADRRQTGGGERGDAVVGGDQGDVRAVPLRQEAVPQTGRGQGGVQVGDQRLAVVDRAVRALVEQ